MFPSILSPYNDQYFLTTPPSHAAVSPFTPIVWKNTHSLFFMDPFESSINPPTCTPLVFLCTLFHPQPSIIIDHSLISSYGRCSVLASKIVKICYMFILYITSHLITPIKILAWSVACADVLSPLTSVGIYLWPDCKHIYLKFPSYLHDGYETYVFWWVAQI